MKQLEDRLKAASLPMVTTFALYIQKAYDAIIELVQENKIPDLKLTKGAESALRKKSPRLDLY